MCSQKQPIDIKKLRLREATIGDCDLLLSWRNDQLTRANSINQNMVSKTEHLNWLEKKLASDTCRIYIAEQDNDSIATIRCDIEKGTYWLSWTVSPLYRRLGIGKHILSMLITQISAPVPLKARVRSSNQASCKIAESNGMKLLEESSGVRIYYLPRDSY